MDVPSVRFLLPCLILYFFHYAFVVNPYFDEASDEAHENRLSTVQAQKLLARSRRFMEEHRWEEAIAPTLELYRAYPENSIYIAQLARLYNLLGRFQEEAQMWEQFLIYAPLPAEGCPQIGLAYRHLHREDKAFEAFERCLALEENADNLMFMAHAHERRGNYQKAEELYRRALQRAPNYPDVIIGLARAEVFRGKPVAARDRILKLLETRPNDPDALLVAGLACFRTGEHLAAMRFLERGRKLRPQDPDFPVVLARVRRAEGYR